MLQVLISFDGAALRGEKQKMFRLTSALGKMTDVGGLRNRKMWGEARFGGTYGVEVGLPARGDMRILM